MRGVFASKHRTSLRKTTALLMQNLGTLPQRSPMFLLFRRKNALKMPETVRKTADALILRYFGPGQALVASMAFSPHYRSTSGRSKRRRKRQSGILHTPCSLLSFPRFAPLCEVASLSLYGLFSSITVTSCGNLPLWHVPSFGGKVQHVAGMEGGIQKKRLENKKTARPFAGRATSMVVLSHLFRYALRYHQPYIPCLSAGRCAVSVQSSMRQCPVISAGCSSPMMWRIEGATSARTPSFTLAALFSVT